MFTWFKSNKTSARRLKFCGLPVPSRIETVHFLLAGTTGTGKTLAIRSLLDSIRERGDRALVLDAGGDLMSLYHAGGDLIGIGVDDECFYIF